jgi:hypothetical protein
MREPDNLDERFLQKGKERYESGETAELLYCLEYCMANHVLIPDWLAKAFGDAYHKVRCYEVKSWDDVFGRPLSKGKRLATERRNVQISSPLFHSVNDRHNAGQPIGKTLFSEVGKEFGVSATTAEEIYYDAVREISAWHAGGDDYFINRG